VAGELGEQMAVDGLDGAVTVLRDEWGIPHVRATTAHDAFFGQGFVHAADRLGQLEYDRRRAYGRWAEVAGRQAVAFDAFTRRCGLPDAARREYEALTVAGRAVLDAYAEGVNAYLDLERALPTDLALAGVRPERWSPWDCNAVFLVRHVVFANWQKKLWRWRVAQTMGVEALAALERDDQPVALVVPPGEIEEPFCLDPDHCVIPGAGLDDGGSNAWALAGARTASGKPLLAGDPHRTVEVPGVYVQNHLACDEFDAIGLAFAGVPGMPHFGHNEFVAWAVTNAYGDYQDLYVELLDAEVAPSRVEVISVRDADDVTISCYETAHGPVVFGDPASGEVLAMQSTALVQPSSGLGVLAPMLHTRTVGELREVMRDWVDPVNNFVSADVHGTIAYQTVGMIPQRSAANAWGPVPGWTGNHEWGEAIRYDELPSCVDPPRGAIVTANQRIVGAAYPHHLSDGYSRPDRAARIWARLDALTGATAKDMAGIHRDVLSLRAPVWATRLGSLSPSESIEQAALALLRDWDGTMAADSSAAAVYMVVRDSVCRRLVHVPGLAELRAPYPGEPPGAFVPPTLRLWPALSPLLALDDTRFLPPGESWDDVLAAALADAVALLRTRFGDDPSTWRWGALHVSAPAHPLSGANPEWASRLDPPTVEMAGEWDTVFASSHAAGMSFAVTGASVARYVFDLSDWDASGWIVPLGAHGDSASPYFADQREDWAAGELVSMRYSWSDIEAHTSAVTSLVPPEHG
jgi:penicillin amidase